LLRLGIADVWRAEALKAFHGKAHGTVYAVGNTIGVGFQGQGTSLDEW